MVNELKKYRINKEMKIVAYFSNLSNLSLFSPYK